MALPCEIIPFATINFSSLRNLSSVALDLEQGCSGGGGNGGIQFRAIGGDGGRGGGGGGGGGSGIDSFGGSTGMKC